LGGGVGEGGFGAHWPRNSMILGSENSPAEAVKTLAGVVVRILPSVSRMRMTGTPCLSWGESQARKRGMF